MPAKKKVTSEPSGRQAAYRARNRLGLLKAGQQVLAEIGPSATIEQLAGYAQVSPTTIYKYFPNKDVLFAEALDQMWREWVVWSYNGAAPASSLEAVIDSARKLFYAKQTHPFFGQVLSRVLTNPSFMIAAVKGGGVVTFQALAKQGLIESEDFDKRIIIWSYILLGLITSVHLTGELSPQEAEKSFAIGLSVWGLSEAKINKLMARPLVFQETK